MNYYINGDAANADKIKAAFERNGIDVTGWEFTNPYDLYFSVDNKIHTIEYSIKHIVTGRHDYKGLELPKPHYDISNFKPFDKVLVRQNDSSTWGVSFFGNCSGGMFRCCNNVWYEQCIPFNEKTEHLLGTTDMPSEEYINW